MRDKIEIVDEEARQEWLRRKYRLPATPSVLIRVALADLAEVERLKRYRVDMGRWHDVRALAEDDDGLPENRCAVCFAGAVMACTMRLPAGMNCEPHEFDNVTYRRLDALDTFRRGWVTAGLAQMMGTANDAMHARMARVIDREEDDVEIGVPAYEADRRGFKVGMRRMVRWLEARGL